MFWLRGIECLWSHFVSRRCPEIWQLKSILMPPPLPPPSPEQNIDVQKKNLVYLIVYSMVIVPFTTSAWFCDVTVYFHHYYRPLKVDVCPLTGKTYAKPADGFQHPSTRQVPAKNNNKSSGAHLNLVSFLLHGNNRAGLWGRGKVRLFTTFSWAQCQTIKKF